MLEDNFEDVLFKAILGSHFTSERLSKLSGISESKIRSLLSGEFDANAMDDLAPHLGLHPQKWIQLPQYSPSTQCPEKLHVFTSPFGELGVNSYAVETAKSWLIFDTGTEAHELALATQDKPRQLFITHNHPDHTACIDDILSHHCYRPGELKRPLSLGGVTITPLAVPGHAYPATAYYIEGLSLPLCVAGDSLFAGSMGRCQTPESFLEAKLAIQRNLLTLPPETILCPGHGPLSTVGQERENNPFF